MKPGDVAAPDDPAAVPGSATPEEAPPPAGAPSDRVELLRIGMAAERASVSPRTLRWYEEIGLLAPASHSSGGARRYSQQDIDRIIQIRELQSLLGFDLGEIRDILRCQDDLAGLRHEYNSGADGARQREILLEATSINDKLRAVVAGKQGRLAIMMDELVEKSVLYASRLKELG
ncbi:MAG TPA: MerR family transcriptional regulator [Acidimicrobiales bacterium]|jgi:DNA-binding transcriptional MerR regulator|nr:MerR family transcriptional regulator [Acidimicrobiales bacterium]